MAFERREHELRADLARVKEARDFADSCAIDFGFPGNERYQLRLAMSEAVTNAIQHGSSSASDPIWLAAADEGGALAFYVRDTGRFIPRVTRGDSMPESGRGLEFMRRLMDEVDLTPGDDGTLVRFSKRRADDRAKQPRRRPIAADADGLG
jgi:anti-sigma regulatory factor (Ser/Thr protein kinase)